MRTMYITEDKNKINVLKELRERDDFSSLIIGKTEFLKKYYFDYTEDTLFYIASKYKVTREIACIYLENLYYLGDNENVVSEKIDFLKELRVDLEKNNLLIFQPMFKSYLKKYKLCFYHIFMQDKFFDKIVVKLKSNYDVSVENLSFVNRKYICYHAKEMVDEVVFVCEQIVSLLKKEISYSDIYVTNLNSDYRKMFKQYGKFFHLDFDFLENNQIYSTPIIQKFIERIKEDWLTLLGDLKAMVNSSKEEKVYQALLSFCNKYILMPKTDEFFNYIKEAIKSISITYEKKEKSIREFDFWHSEVDRKSYVFLVGANQGDFPKFFTDINYLNDKDMMLLNLSQTKDKNKILTEELKLRLSYYDNLILTYKDYSFSASFSVSNFIKELDVKVLDINFLNIYSVLNNELNYAKEMDIYNKYGIVSDKLNDLYLTYKNIDYRNYDNTFKSFRIEKIPFNVLSYTSIDLYNRCPFRFYMANILQLRKFSDTLAIKIGKIYHDILRKSYEKEFNLDLELKSVRNDLKIVSDKDEFFFNKYVRYLKEALEMIKEQESFSSLKNVRCEKEFVISINHGMTLKGIIDKIYSDGERLVVIDYKTGGLELNFNNISYGIGLQLPIYIYLLSESEEKNKTVVGFYLQKIIPSLIKGDYKHSLEELKKKSYKLHGYSLKQEKELALFDSSYMSSKVIDGMKVSKNGFYKYTKVLSEEQIEKMTTLVKEKVLETALKVYNQDFDIKPKRINGVLLGCMFCPYKNICYVKEKDILNLEEKRPAFLGGIDNGMDEGTRVSN